jgi:hypothetical protein
MLGCENALESYRISEVEFLLGLIGRRLRFPNTLTKRRQGSPFVSNPTRMSSRSSWPETLLYLRVAGEWVKQDKPCLSNE